ncbi:hypothetical protein FACS189499_03370 [Clostridia bacterium]|nr:hypothetical protein FACS189499_03370 [Clostridia bacterium]
MGAWGTAIFSDDEAADIKQEYQALVAFGIPNEEAFALTKKYFEVKDDDTVFWLAIAAIQQKYGILLPEVKDRALEIIENGEDLAIWEESADKKSYEKRKQVLQKLRTQLLSEPLPKRRVPKPDIEKHRWDIGDVVAGQIVYNYRSEEWYHNKYVLFRVVEIRKGGISNIIPDLAYDEWVTGLIYDWIGDVLPQNEIITQLPFCKLPSYKGDEPSFQSDTLYWIPKNIKFSLFMKDEHFKLPADFVYSYGNVLGLVHNREQHFRDIYEKYK